GSAMIPVVVEDLCHLSAADQESYMAKWMENEKQRRFEWSTVPLLRIHLHWRGVNNFQFSLSEPFLDGWSVASLVTEILERYSAALKGISQDSVPLQATYADFVTLEQQTIASEEAQRYWSRKFSGATGSRITGSSLLRQ